MARKFLTAIDLSKNELQNAAVQNLAAAPSTPVKGQLYYDSTGNVLYWYNGTAWVSAAGGSVAFGTITAETTFGTAKGDGVASTAARSDHTHGNPTHVAADHTTIPLNTFAAPTGSVNMGVQTIINLAPPSNGTDAATKTYVDNAIAGLSWKMNAKLATTANITLSAHQTIDGVLTTVANRILVKNQTNPAENGIYSASSGGWSRVLDVDNAAEIQNMAVFVTEGSTQADTAWTCTATDPITLGTTALPFVQFGSSSVALNSVDNTKLADMPTLTIKGNDTGATADPKDLTKAAFATMFAGTLGRVFTGLVAAATTTVFTHNFNSLYVGVEVFRNSSPWDTVEADVERTTVNTVTVRFATAPAANDYGVVIFG